MPRRAVAVAGAMLAALVAAVFLVRRPAATTIDPTGLLDVTRQAIVVGGPIGCTGLTEEGTVSLRTFRGRVTVTQGGAAASADLEFLCTRGIQRWEVTAMSDGARPFEAGAARVCLAGRLGRDAWEGCRDVELVPSR